MSPQPGTAATEYDEKELGKVFDARLVRRLGHYLAPYKGLVLTAIGLAIAAAGLRIATPWIGRHMIDHFIPADTPEAWRGLLRYTFFYLGILAALFLVNFFLTYLTEWIGQQGMYDLRKDIFRKLNAQSLRYFDRNPTGRLLTRTTSDVQALNEFLAQGVVNIFTDFVLLFGIIIAWFCFNWRLALLLLLTGPLMGVAAYNFRIRARSAYRAVRLRIAALNAYLQENLAGIRTVQSFNREKGSLAKYAEINGHYRDAQVNTVKEYARFFPLVEAISTLGVVIVLLYGGWKVALGGGAGPSLSVGDFYLYIQYIGWFFMPIQELAEKYNVFQGAMASGERIFLLLDEPIDVADPPNPRIAETLREGVELRDVWFAYKNGPRKPDAETLSRNLVVPKPDAKTLSENFVALKPDAKPLSENLVAPASCRHVSPASRRPVAPPAPPAEPEWVLRGVSLRVDRGRTVALVGATGAGKSTVINLIARLYDVTKGAVLFDGVDVREFSQASLRRRMAVVLQDVFLFSGTIADNIRLGNRAIGDDRVEQAARYVNAHHFIAKLPKGYQNEVLERGATLSTGQKQLLAFARAVAFEPDLLILDEATANIDTETEALIQDALAKLMRDRTCIIVAHRLSTIQNADKIVVFHHGRIHEEGTHQELLRRDGLYRRLYELQYKV